MSKSKSILAVIALFGCCALSSCTTGPSTSPSDLPTTSMQIGSKTYELEIAADDASREHGLMERDSMDKDHGMIFVFDVPAEQSFWMHHTRFPLDILFLDEKDKIVSIHTMKAYDENTTPSNGVSKYAIELNAGEAADDGAKPGDTLKVPAAVDAALKK
jgi:uncharacterized membrane protein (UPF0127 family)